VTKGTRLKKPSSSRGFARKARGTRGTRGTQGAWGSWGLRTENQFFFFSSQQQLPKKKIFKIFLKFFFDRPLERR
jgi:hypothetical protein